MPLPQQPSKPKPKTPRQSKLNFGPASANGLNSKASATKPKQPANGNILNFFKKIEVEETLFLEVPFGVVKSEPASHRTDTDTDDIYGAEEHEDKSSRFNEDRGVSKRRKLSHDSASDVKPADIDSSPPKPDAIPNQRPAPAKKSKKARRGPFLDDSDSDGDAPRSSPTRQEIKGEPLEDVVLSRGPETEALPELPKLVRDESCPAVAPVVLPPEPEDPVFNAADDVDPIEGFIFDDYDDEFADGEEYREMRFMQEQFRLEAAEGDASSRNAGHDDDFLGTDNNMIESCPLCDASLVGISSTQATIHVNACLDGNPIPLPAVPKSPPKTVDAPEVSKRFAKAAAPRPGQANPIHLEGSAATSGSAFSKLMSGHAEDAAWASAAASEHASRGKPAYQRTCPFYKIMPGFFICVDAFRYGAVEGCNAYFLSHFHSDHYIGLTASWCHGPIYCSKVTGSLVKQQLRTAAKWVKELEFEERIEIPGTEGVTVTMLPANHCPGSSLFLFEKKMGKGPTPRLQRILHCGDFRACPAQVTHPLLKPDIIDAVSGKTRQQKIDVCYLDTTYLNPRYSFPPQDDVIQACADFCKSISGDPNADDDAYEAMQREKGSTSVSKFFSKEPSGDQAIKQVESRTKQPRSRLLVICGTYSIGKERICKAIAQALQTKIFASPSKIRIVQQLGDPELSALLTSDPREAQVHMQMLMEIRAETLQEYLNSYKPHFSRIVGFRPSGWNFRNPTSTAKNVSANLSPSALPTTQILHGSGWRTRFGARDFVAQRGSTREAMCFGVPYSEHSSFRELALFVMSLRIEKIVPTVNVGSDQSRKRMKSWLDRWVAERRRGGVVRLLEEEEETQDGDQATTGAAKGTKAPNVLWEGKDGKGGGVFW
ncbi:DNA repair metallo-beta-lactamase-domain-containing protein [Xylariales sp. PMI_506]|nr:DNA repair metallo-beta-lactamase-domain-containing protein [Xylariales sp. PMI_506]